MKKLLRAIFHVDHLIVTSITMMIIWLLVFVTVNVEFLDPVVHALESFSMTDIYYRIENTGKPVPNQQITLVDMTELTSRDRDKIAGVVKQISQMNPTALGIDIIFEGLQANADADDELAEAFFEAPENTVLAFKLTEPDAATGTFGNAVHSFFAQETGLTEGTVNVTNNPHRSMTTYPVFFIEHTDTMLSLPVQLSRMLGAAPLPGAREQTINYKGTAFPVVDYKDLPRSRHLIENHIVLLGSTREESDKHLTPLGQRPGMEIMAYTLLSILEGVHVYHAPFWQCLLWALLTGILTNIVDLFLTRRLERSHSTVLLFLTESEFYEKFMAFMLMALLTLCTFLFFVYHNYYVNSILALSTIVILPEGRLLYIALLTVLKKKLKWKAVDHSLYAEEVNEKLQ